MSPVFMFIFLFISLEEVCRHAFVITSQKRSPNKAISFALRALSAVVLSYLDPRPMWAVLPAMAVLDWWFHDYLLGLLIWSGKQPIWHLNSTGFFDELQNKYPNAGVWFVWKTIAMIGLVGAYFVNF